MTNVVAQLCPQCRGGENEKFGPGSFQDIDSKTSFDVPVCGSCGGLGAIIEDVEFETECKRILDLRHKYCPMERNRIDQLPYILMAQYLQELVRAVRAHYVKYKAVAVDECFAEFFFEKDLGKLITQLKQTAADEFKALGKEFPKGNPGAEACHALVVMAFSGKLEKLEESARDVLQQFPDNSDVLFVVGVVVYLKMLFNLDEAERCMVTAAKMKPFKQARVARVLEFLEKINKPTVIVEMLDFILRENEFDALWRTLISNKRDFYKKLIEQRRKAVN